MPTQRPPLDTPQTVVSVALIEDNRLAREGLTALLNQSSGLSVVHAGSRGQLLEIERVRPRIVLMDVGLENGDSVALVRSVHEELPQTAVIVTDLLPSWEDMRDFIEAGVSGFVLKDASLEELVSTIRTVAGGCWVLPSTMTHSLFSQIADDAGATRGHESADHVKLTPREREVIALIAEGYSNKGIAARLHVSIHTVKSHVRSVMDKLALHTRLQVAAWVHHELDVRVDARGTDGTPSSHPGSRREDGPHSRMPDRAPPPYERLRAARPLPDRERLDASARPPSATCRTPRRGAYRRKRA